ncbi:MAG: hypothetical protein IAF38_08405 [Bacteroidia bacterium]|nr:hypothetical protein [Bacteroidia bacterium]
MKNLLPILHLISGILPIFGFMNSESSSILFESNIRGNGQRVLRIILFLIKAKMGAFLAIDGIEMSKGRSSVLGDGFYVLLSIFLFLLFLNILIWILSKGTITAFRKSGGSDETQTKFMGSQSETFSGTLSYDGFFTRSFAFGRTENTVMVLYCDEKPVLVLRKNKAWYSLAPLGFVWREGWRNPGLPKYWCKDIKKIAEAIGKTKAPALNFSFPGAK